MHKSIDSIELLDEKKIMVRGSGFIKADLQIVSNSDLRRGEGAVLSEPFPLEFTLCLIIENATRKPEDEKYLLDDVDFRIDTTRHY